MFDPDQPGPPPALAGDPLTKVLPPGGPLLAFWTCPRCDRSRRGSPPPACFSIPARSGCPLEAGAPEWEPA